ncbi:hypothetical protein GCM10010168_67560 [Actinoplanes ianthinogenes]|uniref:YcxB-like protein domain-containing protein n=1 Tax=Actinoplanes ianthinogenes TaxID=122358 RepID=A0ABN6CIJ5_9ACTN|nr:YcxB family protein [Actinoplanes ianthinogenes]BCJ43953.1 hypothetical protein Aiant_46100 [Actinoplanes ianthinogenes]GGR39390.1 hypothetical protein GCM10010168_67560 [Actinoplanes ianthinogenes]
MQISGEYGYTFGWLRRMFAAMFPRSRQMRIAGGALTVFFALFLAFDDEERTRSFWLVLTGLILTFNPEALAALTWLTQRKHIATPMRYILTEAGAEIQGVNSSTRVSWSGLAWVRLLPDMWLLRNGAASIAIPRAAFTPADQATVDAFLTNSIMAGAVRAG